MSGAITSEQLTSSKKFIDYFMDKQPSNPSDMPKDLVIIVFAAADLGNNLAAQIISILRREAARGPILLRPPGDAGPAQLTSWWKKNQSSLIVGNAYGNWNGRSEKPFDGSVEDNIATLRNIILFSNERYGSFEKTAYWYGPGNAQAPRDSYAKAVVNNFNKVYKPFFDGMSKIARER